MKVLIVGGTRNVGHLLTLVLLEAGHQVTVFNRGQTIDELPSAVTRIHGDRNAPAGLAQALAAADYDAVVDMVLYDGAQAQRAVAQLAGRTGHYVFISTGQVYLVREGLPRPFVEEDYNGGTPVPEPRTRHLRSRGVALRRRQAAPPRMCWRAPGRTNASR